MKTILICVSLLVCVATSGADLIQPRGGLDNTFKKLLNGERTVIAYFGGSITAGAGASKGEFCYRSLLTQHLKEQFPKAQVVEVNAAIGGTGSWLGAFRLKNDVLGQKPDLVVVEFAVNDGGAPEPQVYASMEGIARQIRAANPQADILHVYTLVKGHLDAFKNGKLPERMLWHEKIAEHYSIPSVNMAQHAASKILSGELTIDEFAKDGVHPTDRGYALYLDALKPFIAQCKAQAEKAAEPKSHAMPKPFSERAMEKAQMVSYEKAAFDDKWKTGQQSPVDKFTHVLASDAPGATITLSFKGDSIGYYDAIGPDTGDLEFSIDGGDWKARSNWDQWCRNSFRAHCRIIVENLDPAATHELRLRVAEKQPPESKGRFFRAGYFLVNGTVAAEDPYKNKTPLEKIDAIYAEMAPVKFVAPPERWAHLPQTMKKLGDGPALKIVMLGDSIINDTSSSKYELLFGRMYPKCKIEKVTSVRGSTGCWWYKEENRVKEYVLDHKPDLLIIGGISQRDDVESIRDVIKQVRAVQAVEVLLMTGPFGHTDPKKKDWSPEINSNGSDYRAKLMKLAAEEKCEFFDMQGAWGQYIRESEKARGWFMRDAVHANERGFQVLGRILEKYFAPK